jgi:hypothetical protein
MNNLYKLLILLVILTASGCTTKKTAITSPDGQIELNLAQNELGELFYTVHFNEAKIIDTSYLGFEFTNQAQLKQNLIIESTETSSFDETWEMPWGEQRTVQNNYNQLSVKLAEKNNLQRSFTIHFRAFNDGVAFRYEFPEVTGTDSLYIKEELTQFNLTHDHTCWWIPGDWDIYEHLYTESKISEINAYSYRGSDMLIASYIPNNAVNTPVTLRTDEGIHLSFHEANLTNYPGMTLEVDSLNLGFSSTLVGSERTEYKAAIPLPFNTPWRTITITDKATELIDSKMILNLNEPNKLGDVSWFKPMKYNGIWWEMHLGISTWDYAGTQDMNSYKGVEPHGRHGATTENAKKYIDFASENNIEGVLVEGWNTGWERWVGFEDREGVFDFVTSYPDYDLEEVVRYGKEKGVDLVMHHETSSTPRTYAQQLDTAYALMQSLGIHSVKTGYVGKIIPKGEYHHGQWMVNHYRHVLETAAKYEVAINAHEPIKATGIRRTLPNAISREGLRGQEFNAWATDGGNRPDHLPTVAFTRMLAGPIDFTPGVFNIKLDPYKPDNQVNTTLAHQLALYVVIYSPIQMACDLVESYEGQPAFQFIRDVAIDWDETVVLNGEVGEFVSIARKQRDSNNWFVGGITDEEARTININFDFLDEGTSYKCILYSDAKDAHWDKNPVAIDIKEVEIDTNSNLEISLAPGGGFAISLLEI